MYSPYSTFGNIPNYVESKVENIENRAQKIIGKPLPYSMQKFQKRRISPYVHRCLTNNVCKNFENYSEVIESKIQWKSYTIIKSEAGSNSQTVFLSR